MLKKAVAYYHELLKDFDLAESSRQSVGRRLRGCAFDFRRSPPYAVSAPAFCDAG